MKFKIALRVLLFSLVVFIAQAAIPVDVVTAEKLGADTKIFFTPNRQGHAEVIDLINKAQKSILLTIFNMNERHTIEALVAAHKRGVQVRVLLDRNIADKSGDKGAYEQLVQNKIPVQKSSPQFSISHQKTLLIDGTTSVIMTQNLTRLTSFSRDVGLILQHPEVAAFLHHLFELDWQNAIKSTGTHPTNIPRYFIIAPVDALDKILALLSTAQKSVKIEVENLSNYKVLNKLKELRLRGVKVAIVVPRCTFAEDPDFNLKSAQEMAAAGIDVRLVVRPYGSAAPYIHQKSIVIDDKVAFIGSENLSYNSLNKAREVGVVFSDENLVTQLKVVFEHDLQAARPYEEAQKAACNF